MFEKVLWQVNLQKDRKREVSKKILTVFGSAALLAFFGFLTWSVDTQAGWVNRLDTWGNNVFRLEVFQNVTDVIFGITRIGDIQTLIIMGGLVGVILLIQKRWEDFWWFGISAVFIGGLMPLTFKLLLQRPRPTDGLMTRGGYSFPSGHALGTLAVYGLICLLVCMYLKKLWLRKLILIVATLVILLVSWSRIHLGFHFISDIFGSWSIGLGLLLVAWLILQRMNRKKVWRGLVKWK